MSTLIAVSLFIFFLVCAVYCFKWIAIIALNLFLIWFTGGLWAIVLLIIFTIRMMQGSKR